MEQIIESCQLRVLVFFELVFNCRFTQCRIFFHFLYNFVVYRHCMKPNDKADYLWFYCLYFFEKRQFSQLRDRYSLFRVSDQHSLNDFNSLDTNITWKNIEALYDFFIKLFGSFFLERQRSTDHSIKDNAQRPKISNDSIVFFACYHFRWSIARTSTSSSEIFSLLIVIGEPKVN